MEWNQINAVAEDTAGNLTELYCAQKSGHKIAGF
jgi:hypothetical protein